ncbi:hypothetical protein AAEL04_003322 [Klebsiella aerogenes]
MSVTPRFGAVCAGVYQRYCYGFVTFCNTKNLHIHHKNGMRAVRAVVNACIYRIGQMGSE